MGHHNSYDKESVQAPGSKWNGLVGILGVAGIALTAGGFAMAGKEHGSFSYLTSYMFYLSIALGGMFFVLINHLVRSGWATTSRRLAEGLMKNVLLMAILFAPIAVNLDTLFAWTDLGQKTEVAASKADLGIEGYVGRVELYESRSGKTAEKKAQNTEKWRAHLEHVLLHKKGYLSPNFFYARVAFYFIVLIGLAFYLFKGSKSLDDEEDAEKQAATIVRLGRASAPGLMLFSLVITFIAFDWIMSTDYGWFSTIFGVIYFAGAIVATFSTLILVGKFLQSKGYLKGALTVEHYHDYGKFLWGFMVFWTYVSFSQLILIWYADLPEETSFFHARWNEIDGWRTLSWIIIFGHFVLPFFILLSRHVKRSSIGLPVMAVWMFIVSWLHIYWEIMPNMRFPGVAEFNFQFADVMFFLGLGGLFFAGFFLNLKNSKLIPENDPRLKEAINFHNY